MKACLKEISGRIEFAIEFKGRTAGDVRQKMDEVMEARGEGLVIKHPSSKYVLNGRNKDWIKVKPEYMVRFLRRCHWKLYDAHIRINRITWVRPSTFSSLVSSSMFLHACLLLRDRRQLRNWFAWWRSLDADLRCC